MSVQQPLPLTGVVPDRTGNYRTDHLLVADMVERGSKVLDVGCGDGELLQLLETRGIDVENISHVVNYDLPNIPESYVHRIGRTARAGAGGIAISLCDREERSFLRDIEKLIRQAIPVVAPPAGLPATAAPLAVAEDEERRPAAHHRPGGQKNGRSRQPRNHQGQERHQAQNHQGQERNEGVEILRNRAFADPDGDAFAEFFGGFVELGRFVA